MDIHEIRSLLDEWARNRARIGELSEKYRTAAELLDKVRAALAGAVVAEPWAPVVEFGDVDAAEGFLGRYSDHVLEVTTTDGETVDIVSAGSEDLDGKLHLAGYVFDDDTGEASDEDVSFQFDEVTRIVIY